MEHFNLPIIKGKTHMEKHLTMDEYLRFVIDNLKYAVDITTARKLKKNLFVGRQFILK